MCNLGLRVQQIIDLKTDDLLTIDLLTNDSMTIDQ